MYVKCYDNKKTWSLYKITNQITGKIYVGYTRGKVLERWKQHCRDARNNSTAYFHKCICKYGEDRFHVRLLMIFTSKNQAMQAEKKYIADQQLNRARYRDGIGMNLTDGGDGSGGHLRSDEAKEASAKYHRRPVSAWTKGSPPKHVCDYPSLASAMETFNGDRRNPTPISNVLQGRKKTAYGLLWTYKGESPPEPFEDERGISHRISVCQYTHEGEFVAEHESIKAGAYAVGGSPSHIGSCCKGNRKQHKGYLWCLAGEIIDGPYKRKSEKRKRVAQYHALLVGLGYRVYESAAQAAKALGCSQSLISMCARGEIQTAKGYKWEYI